MTVENAIKERRSIRKYTDQPVSNLFIRKIIEAGTFAPSADNSQTWRFTVLTNEEKNKFTDFVETQLNKFDNKSIGSANNTCNIMKEAPVLMLIWNTGSVLNSQNKAEIEQFKSFFKEPDKIMLMVELQGVSAAIQNMHLTAHNMGLGSLWINDIYYVKNEIEEYFGYGWELIAGVTLGYPDRTELGKIPPKRLSVDEVTEFR
jgi:nitroreductase